jgi:hypothetical protein
MQLGRLAGVACAAMLWHRSASAEPPAEAPRLEGSVRVYADDDRVTVVTPSARGEAPVSAELSADAEVVVDIVSAASVDVVTQASPATVREQRVELGAGLRYAPSSTTAISARAIGSHENDYDALRLSAGGSAELAERNLALALTYTLGLDAIGSAVDPALSASRQSHLVALSLTQIADPRTYLDLVVDAGWLDGYHASPYRRVPIESATTPAVLRVEEQTPERRLRLAALVRARHAFGAPARWFAQAWYRYYLDDWAIDSHTAGARLARELGGDTELGLQLRAYRQSAAEFYRARYIDDGEGAPRYRSRDRTLGRMSSVYAQLVVERGWLLASAGVVRFEFRDFPAQTGRTAAIVSLGASAQF